jgi:hypothetical protein
MFIADEKRSHPKGRRREGSLARFPLGWNYPSDKKSPKSKMLEQVLIANGCQLLGNLRLRLRDLLCPSSPRERRSKKERAQKENATDQHFADPPRLYYYACRVAQSEKTQRAAK